MLNLFNSSKIIPTVKNDNPIILKVKEICGDISELSEDDKIATINKIKMLLHEVSPMKNEPVDCVLWVYGSNVVANDYNPNSVAPPEMKLLEHSIQEDGYTQPIVSFLREGEILNQNAIHEVVDGFHRNRVGKESKVVNERIKGYLPLVTINQNRLDKGDRIAATIRHNRARGKHKIDSMSQIILDLKRRNWSNKKIGKELGMDPDEVLRLAQITGLAEMFSDKSFSMAWEAEVIDEDDSLDDAKQD